MPVAIAVPEASTSEPYRYDEKSDFKGGLNLRADQFNIAYNESPALLNVEVDPRGGVRRRDAITKVNSTALDNEIISLMTHYEAGTNQVLAASLDPAPTTVSISLRTVLMPGTSPCLWRRCNSTSSASATASQSLAFAASTRRGSAGAAARPATVSPHTIHTATRRWAVARISKLPC